MSVRARGSVRFVGRGLSRPECALAHSSGAIVVPDWTPPGGVSLIGRTGESRRHLMTKREEGVPHTLRPNGIALEPGGAILMAHLGEERGGIYRLYPDGTVRCVTDTIEGRPMPPANFVAVDGERLWITVSTTKVPRALDYRPDAATGLIACHEGGRTRVAADGLGYANECLLSPDGGTLWVNETFGRQTTAFTLREGALSAPKVHARYGAGTYPDGLALTASGSLVVVSIVSNRVIAVGPDGRQAVWVEDADEDHVAAVEQAFAAGEMGREHLDRTPAKTLRQVSNIAFAGDDLRTAVLGCLLDTRLPFFDAPEAGVPPRHWHFDLGPLGDPA